MCAFQESAGCVGKESTASCQQHGVEGARPPAQRPALWTLHLGSFVWIMVVMSGWMQPLPQHWSLTTHPWPIYLRLPLAAWLVAATCTMLWQLSYQARAVQREDDASMLCYTAVTAAMQAGYGARDLLTHTNTALQELATPGVRRLCKWPNPLCSPPALLPLLPPPGWPAGILHAAGWALASCALLWLLVQRLPWVLEKWWDRLQGAYQSRSPLADPLLPPPVGVAQCRPLTGAMHLTTAMVAATTAILANLRGAGPWWTAALLLGLGAAVVCLYRGMVIISAWQHLDAAKEAAADAEPELGAGRA